MRAFTFITFIALTMLSACSGPTLDSRLAAYVYGWTGNKVETSNVYDPYIEGMYRRDCAAWRYPEARCVLFTHGPDTDQSDDLVMIIVSASAAENVQQRLNEYIAAVEAPAGCVLEKTQPTYRSIGYSYGYATCGNLDWYYLAAIASNRWNHTYFVLSQKKYLVPKEREMIDILESIRFPA